MWFLKSNLPKLSFWFKLPIILGNWFSILNSVPTFTFQLKVFQTWLFGLSVDISSLPPPTTSFLGLETKFPKKKKNYTKLAFKKSLASLVHPFWNMQTSTSCPTMVLWYLHKMTTLIQPVRKLQDFMILMKPFEKMFLTKVPPAQLYQTSQDLIQPRSTNSDRASMFASFFSNGIWIHMTPSKAKKNDFE